MPAMTVIFQLFPISIAYSISQQEQQRIAVGLGNANFISIRQVSSDAATLRRCTCGAPLLLLLPPRLLRLLLMLLFNYNQFAD